MKKITDKLDEFNEWMNYNPPFSLTTKEWRLFREEFRCNAPIRFWIKDSLRKIRHSFVLPFKWKYKVFSGWISYRTYENYNVVKTG